jgi:hypothetical protein
MIIGMVAIILATTDSLFLNDVNNTCLMGDWFYPLFESGRILGI